MRKILVTCMASLLSCSAAFAFWPEAADSSFELDVAYRRDKFTWQIGCDTFVPVDDVTIPAGLSSKLEWKDLNIWQIGARFKYVTCDNIYFRAYGDYGWITDGKVTDSDFLSISDYTGGTTTFDFTSDYYSDYSYSSGYTFAHSSSKAKKGHVYDASLGIGYQFKLCDDSFAITPLVGYSWHGQHLNIHNGCNDLTSYYSSISNLHSKYNTRWNGPWLGLDFDYRFACDWEFFVNYEYHWAWYHAKADWNLRTDLPNGFHHRSNSAHGQIAEIGVRWDLCECWSVGLTGKWMWFTAKHGKDIAKIAEASAGDVEVDCFLKIPLRHVKWQSGSIAIDVGMVF